MKTRPMGGEFFHMDRRTDLMQLIVVFPNLVKELNNGSKYQNKIGDDRRHPVNMPGGTAFLPASFLTFF
jgi:hypothetical protein